MTDAPADGAAGGAAGGGAPDPIRDTARAVLDMARAQGLRLATAESCTGGLVAAALTAIPGSSDVVVAGLVTYANSAKTALLGVTPATLARHGAVSEACAREMAAGALRATGAGLAVAVTGIAGPGGSATKPEGRVCFALARADGAALSVPEAVPVPEDVPEAVPALTRDFGALGRDGVRAAATLQALRLLQAALAGPAQG